ncbi:MAG: lactate utilization protein B/C, partial [Chitinophagaceae bacterium]
MNVSPSKENILKKIRKALSHSTPLPFPQSEGNQPVFQPLEQEMEVEFAEQFTRLQGKFIYCINQQEFAFQLSSLIKKQDWEKVYC